MRNTQHDFVSGTHNTSLPQMLRNTCKFVLGTVVGAGLLLGLTTLALIVIAIILYKVQPKFTAILLILGGLVVLGSTTVWLIGRHLWRQAKSLIMNSSSPEVNTLLMNASAVFVIFSF